MYDRGEGVEQNYETAAELYKKSAEQGSARAQNNLALMYEFGEGVSKDLEEAARLYKLAADQHYASAKLNLERLSKGNEDL